MSYTPLKEIYNKDFYSKFTIVLNEIIPFFKNKKFLDLIFDSNWKNRELKDRMRHTTRVLNRFLDSDFNKACNQILKMVNVIDLSKYKYGSLAYMFLPDYIETYGLNNFDISMKTLQEITHFTSSEFAVRAFILQDQEKALKLMLEWSYNKNYHIRRLASEGCRPMLPWAMALPFLKNNPSPILSILENLKNDPEDYVYRSVANNLNDISKNQAELVLDIAKNWKGKSKTTDWLVKHALRTLLKKGNSKAMQLLGYGSPKDVSISNLIINNTNLQIGTYLHFSFKIHSSKKAINRLEYAIYFLLKNGKQSKKVFKISEKEYQKDSFSIIKKRHSFKIISTRKYYSGEHKISIIINGVEKAFANFTIQ